MAKKSNQSPKPLIYFKDLLNIHPSVVFRGADLQEVQPGAFIFIYNKTELNTFKIYMKNLKHRNLKFVQKIVRLFERLQ